MRTRLNFQYDFGSDVTAFAELQAHEAFGEDVHRPVQRSGRQQPDPATWQMYQSWIEIKNMFGRPEISTRIGRQEIVLGNQFQFGNADWYNGVVHDGIRVDWKSNCWNLTLLASKLTSTDGDFNQLWSYVDLHNDDELYAAYFTLKSIRALQIDLYYIYVNGHGFLAHNSGTQLGYDGGVPLSVQQRLLPHVRRPRRRDAEHRVRDRLQRRRRDPGGDQQRRGRGRRCYGRGRARGGPSPGAPLPDLRPRALCPGPGYEQHRLPDRSTRTATATRASARATASRISSRWRTCRRVQLGLHFDPGCNWTVGATGLWAQADEDLRVPRRRRLRHRARHLGRVPAQREPDARSGRRVRVPGRLRVGRHRPVDDTQIIGYLQARLVF